MNDAAARSLGTLRFIAHGLVACACIGCQNQPYQLAPVSGVVTLDGQPVPGTVVNFQPASSGNAEVGPGSTGRCDDQGRFTLTTIQGDAGAVVGTHRVRIYSYSPESAAASDSDTADTPQERFPVRYNYRSQLQFVVEAGGTTSAEFALTSGSDG